MAITTHMCKGNFRSSWVAQGGYDYVAEALFGELDVDGFFMEWDDARSGGFEPLRFVPPGKHVVLGLVTTKKGDLEDKDLLKRRIGIPATLSSITGGRAVTRADFPRLVEVAYADLCHQTNPRKCAKADFEKLFADAL